MNVCMKLAAIVLAAVPIVAAAEDKEQKIKCSEMLYSKEFLDNYPKSPAACQDVVIRDGQKYARFWAEVKSMKGDHLTVSIKNVLGDSLGLVTFAIKPEARVTMDGKPVKYSSLERGQKLDIWVPQSKMGFYAAPGASELSIVSREAG